MSFVLLRREFAALCGNASESIRRVFRLQDLILYVGFEVMWSGRVSAGMQKILLAQSGLPFSCSRAHCDALHCRVT